MKLDASTIAGLAEHLESCWLQVHDTLSMVGVALIISRSLVRFIVKSVAGHSTDLTIRVMGQVAHDNAAKKIAACALGDAAIGQGTRVRALQG